ncbi:MAG: H-NS family nucleoid-associated regulatory protein, partial [Rhodoplanes sp.]
ERQIALLDGGNSTGHGKRRGRPAGGGARASALKGKSVPPKYRGPGGETWAGLGATPRWLTALVKEGHSIEEFLIGARRKGKPAAIKKKVMKKKVAKPARKPRRRKEGETSAGPAAAA